MRRRLLESGRRRFLFGAIGSQVSAEARDEFVFLASVEIVLKLFEGEVDDVVMVKFFRLDEVTEAEPETVQEIDFVGSEIRRMRAEDFEDFIPGGHVNFEIELRLRVAEAFPGFADLTSLLFALPFSGGASDDGGRLQALPSAENTVPEIIRSDDRKANGFAPFFGKAKRLREKMLLDGTEELVGVEFLFTGSGAAEDADVKNHYVAAARLDSIKNVGEVVEIELIADGNKDVAGLGANGFRSELAFDFEIELIHLNVSDAGLARMFFRNCENDKEKYGKCAAGESGDGFGEEVDDCDGQQGEGDKGEAERNVNAVDGEIEGNLKIACARLGVAKDENCEAIHGEGPDDAEGVKVCEEVYIAAADDDCSELKQNDDIDDAIAGTEFGVRLTKPGWENAVF